MSTTNVSNTYTSNQNQITIPDNTSNVTVTVRGARGGNGGNYSGIGFYGKGRTGSFTFINNFVQRNLKLVVGGVGSDGSSPGGGNGGTSTVAIGGTGGSGSYTYSYDCSYPSICTCPTCCGKPCSNSAPCSGGYVSGSGCAEGGNRWICPQTCFATVNTGGGGGGGGASAVINNSTSTNLIVAGGGGGGGGGAGLGNGSDGGSWSTTVTPVSSGSNGSNRGSNGGTGGGGGGVGGTSAAAFAGGSSGYNSSVLTLNSSTVWETAPEINISYVSYTPVINSFYYTPDPQTSGINGNPTDQVTLGWSTSDVSSVSINQGVGTVNTSGSVLVSTGLQSTAGTTSPATKSYTLTACAGSTCVNSTITVAVYNDNTPNTITIPTTTTSGASLNNLAADTVYQILIGPVTGIDMITAVNCSQSAGLDATLNGTSFSAIQYISNNQSVYLRFTSQPFNSDPAGLTNSRTYNFTIGTYSGSFTAITRAPDVNETFDFGDSNTNFPYPEIDQSVISPTQYLTSPTTVVIDDTEIPVEIKTNQSDSQIRIKPLGAQTFGSWQSTRSI